ncbi:MAG: ATP-binding cassette domain-containing protein [Tepidimonas sp.]|uniref:ATP-binding cassette domain-containing protein n=1 Tax=Tepidimonas sp. TaxID=2002775 RepID=UPI004054F0BD
MEAPLFLAEGLGKRYDGKPVVDDLSFSIAPGECVGLLGPNGAGKTTTLRMALGLTTPDAGRIHILGREMPAEAQAIKARVGVVAQFDTLDPDFTCAENLLVYGRYFGLRPAELRPRVAQLLDFAALEHKAGARPGELSGGMRRRLSLARALVNDPALLLLDEPTTGLDPQARHLMWERLQRLLQQGKSILLTTHFMDEAERLCHRLVIIDHGRKIAEGRPRELIAQHLEPEVVEVYGEQGWSAGPAHALLGPEARHLASRMETSGETVFFYTHDARPLLAHLGERARLRVLHRPANLEDLFLKLTGRQIRADG